MLQQIADVGKGKYVRATASDDGMSIILKELEKLEKKEFSAKMFTVYEEQFRWFLGLALILLLIEFMLTDRKSQWWSRLKLFEEKDKRS